MNLFRSRNRRAHRDATVAAVPAGGGSAAAPARFADPIAQAMSAGDRRSADVMWFGGVSFRIEGETR
jgi:hypothetical protein